MILKQPLSSLAAIAMRAVSYLAVRPSGEAFKPTLPLVVRPGPSRNGYVHWLPAFLKLSICGAAGLLASGCSMSIPIAGFVDETPTGSIDNAANVVAKELDQEDWRRAKAAMAVALDPQGNGASVTWDNPKSGAKGTFAAMAPAFPKRDKICRKFEARVAPDMRTQRDVQGSACRGSDGEWLVADAKELKVAEAKDLKKGRS